MKYTVYEKFMATYMICPADECNINDGLCDMGRTLLKHAGEELEKFTGKRKVIDVKAS